MEDPISSGAQKKETSAKDGAVLDSEPCGPLYRGGDCCFSSCAYTSDHYHCQVCGISTPEVCFGVHLLDLVLLSLKC